MFKANATINIESKEMNIFIEHWWMEGMNEWMKKKKIKKKRSTLDKV